MASRPTEWGDLAADGALARCVRESIDEIHGYVALLAGTERDAVESTVRELYGALTGEVAAGGVGSITLARLRTAARRLWLHRAGAAIAAEPNWAVDGPRVDTLAGLTPAERTVLVLRVVNRMPPESVASALGIAPERVGELERRAARRLGGDVSGGLRPWFGDVRPRDDFVDDVAGDADATVRAASPAPAAPGHVAPSPDAPSPGAPSPDAPRPAGEQPPTEAVAIAFPPVAGEPGSVGRATDTIDAERADEAGAHAGVDAAAAGGPAVGAAAPVIGDPDVAGAHPTVELAAVPGTPSAASSDVSSGEPVAVPVVEGEPLAFDPPPAAPAPGAVGDPDAAEVASRTSRRRPLVAVAALVVVGLVATGVVWLLTRDGADDVADEPIVTTPASSTVPPDGFVPACADAVADAGAVPALGDVAVFGSLGAAPALEVALPRWGAGGGDDADDAPLQVDASLVEGGVLVAARPPAGADAVRTLVARVDVDGTVRWVRCIDELAEVRAVAPDTAVIGRDGQWWELVLADGTVGASATEPPPAVPAWTDAGAWPDDSLTPVSWSGFRTATSDELVLALGCAAPATPPSSAPSSAPSTAAATTPSTPPTTVPGTDPPGTTVAPPSIAPPSTVPSTAPATTAPASTAAPVEDPTACERPVLRGYSTVPVAPPTSVPPTTVDPAAPTVPTVATVPPTALERPQLLWERAGATDVLVVRDGLALVRVSVDGGGGGWYLIDVRTGTAVDGQAWAPDRFPPSCCEADASVRAEGGALVVRDGDRVALWLPGGGAGPAVAALP